MRSRGFDFGDFEITKREILASISIIAVMLLIGFTISGRISNYILDRNEKYNKAIKIVIGLCVFGFYYIDNEWIEN